MLGKKTYGRYSSSCQLRPPGDARMPCKATTRVCKRGRRWASCKGRRGLAEAQQPTITLVAAPSPRKPTRFALKAIWVFLGRPQWGKFKAHIAAQGIAHQRYQTLSKADTELIMRTWYARIGLWRLTHDLK